jgi:HPr kinase/phosphorylase
MTRLNLHATAVSWSGAALLLRGPSGAGKSDLALRLIDQGAVLIADDRVDLRCEGGVLFASPPAALAGLIEARGVGLLRLPYHSDVPVAWVVDLVAGTEVDRMPKPETTALLGVLVPLVKLDPWPASATLKLRLAVGQALLDKGHQSN